MDLKGTGKFIQECRKAKGWTQADSSFFLLSDFLTILE